MKMVDKEVDVKNLPFSLWLGGVNHMVSEGIFALKNPRDVAAILKDMPVEDSSPSSPVHTSSAMVGSIVTVAGIEQFVIQDGSVMTVPVFADGQIAAAQLTPQKRRQEAG